MLLGFDASRTTCRTALPCHGPAWDPACTSTKRALPDEVAQHQQRRDPQHALLQLLPHSQRVACLRYASKRLLISCRRDGPVPQSKLGKNKVATKVNSIRHLGRFCLLVLGVLGSTRPMQAPYSGPEAYVHGAALLLQFPAAGRAPWSLALPTLTGEVTRLSRCTERFDECRHYFCCILKCSIHHRYRLEAAWKPRGTPRSPGLSSFESRGRLKACVRASTLPARLQAAGNKKAGPLLGRPTHPSHSCAHSIFSGPQLPPVVPASPNSCRLNPDSRQDGLPNARCACRGVPGVCWRDSLLLHRGRRSLASVKEAAAYRSGAGGTRQAGRSTAQSCPPPASPSV